MNTITDIKEEDTMSDDSSTSSVSSIEDSEESES
jgi:hypothetical protein